MDQPATYPQQYPAPGAAMPMAVPPAGALPRQSILGKMKRACERNGGVAVAIIVILLVVVVYLFARLKGWIGKGGKDGPASKAPSKRRKTSGKRAAASARAAPEDEEDEIDSLIDAIES